MKTPFSLCLVLIAALASAFIAAGETRYVNVNNPAPLAPYTNWATAATVIQDAVDVALPGDEIVVTNGLYACGGSAVYPGMTNRVAINKPLMLRSVNGPEVTVIRGYQVPGTTNGPGAVRCVYLTNGATIIGFTLTNGATLTGSTLTDGAMLGDHRFVSGGGVWCESPHVIISNCFLVGNAAGYGGAAFWGTLEGCRLSFNTARIGGGAVRSILNRCVLTNNSARQGGGAFNASLNQSTIAENTAGTGGGVSRCALNRCLVLGNRATGIEVGSGTGGGALSSSLTNCLVLGNTAQSGGGAWGSSLINCTVVSNTAALEGGGLWVSTDSGGCAGSGCDPSPECDLSRCHGGNSLVVNCVIYDNTASTGANHLGFNGGAFRQMGEDYFRYSILDWSCTMPMPTNGVGNITNAPLFVSAAGGNFRLQSNSPCINAGRNAYAPAGSDLDGNPRIAGGTVDIGAYEFQSPQSTLSYAWLQQYDLPLDGSLDFDDLDGDGQSNWHECRAGTDPFNSFSLLRLLTPTVSTNGIIVQWHSVIDRAYRLERSGDLSQSGFQALGTNIIGQPVVTTFADTNAPVTQSFFYRVRVEE